MAETRSHKAGKGSAARKEVPISGGRRLDAVRGHYAVEVERSGTKSGINAALSRLRTQTNKAKILRVPQPDMDKALQLAKQKHMNVAVTNIAKTKRKHT
ncbi:MAG: hypothetical protein KJ963_00960 [Bacteroidetes bacterium]|nr:hypothetical protein [Bacteroidota bacterium]MBU1423136.1 hypothetical protein [Bacteroidota bacterium]MBU2635648.1 hypothetical protein [Bacteroidota bacterium]